MIDLFLLLEDTRLAGPLRLSLQEIVFTGQVLPLEMAIPIMFLQQEIIDIVNALGLKLGLKTLLREIIRNQAIPIILSSTGMRTLVRN